MSEEKDYGVFKDSDVFDASIYADGYAHGYMNWLDPKDWAEPVQERYFCQHSGQTVIIEFVPIKDADDELERLEVWMYPVGGYEKKENGVELFHEL